MTKTVDVVIPVYNERDNLLQLLQRLSALSVFDSLHLIFVDNASTDGSADFLETVPNISLVRHTSNRGYGASLRSGMASAITDRWVILDADGEYPPECIPDLLAALEKSQVVYASRLLGKSSAVIAGMPLFKWLGNKIISGLFNVLFRQQVTDLYTGCKALRRESLQGIHLQRDGFEQVLELAAILAQRGIAITEVPVDFSPRQRGASKMSHGIETLKFIFWLLFYRLRKQSSE